jgi:hypothetical protein
MSWKPTIRTFELKSFFTALNRANAKRTDLANAVVDGKSVRGGGG